MTGSPRVTFHDDPAAFLAEAGDHLAADPLVATITATSAERAAADDAAGVAHDLPYRWWAVVRDEVGTIVGVAMRTAPFAPYPLFLLPMPDEAAHALATALAGRDEQVDAVNGASPATRACAEVLARRVGGRVQVTRQTRLHRADAVQHPVRPDGTLRPAAVEEVDLVLAWFGAFGAAADEQAGRTSGTPHGVVGTRESMARRIEAGEVWLWCDPRGTPVHLSAFQPPAYGVARIAPVFTPLEHRGRGYAGATVAALSQRILDDGAVPCLFTDLENPTSNRLYARLGYEPVVDMADLRIG